MSNNFNYFTWVFVQTVPDSWKKKKVKSTTTCTKYLLHNFACTITLMANAITHYVSTAACTNWQVLKSGFLRSLVNLFGVRRLQERSLGLWAQEANLSVGYATITRFPQRWELNSVPIACSDIDLFPGKQWWVLNFMMCSSVPMEQTALHSKWPNYLWYDLSSLLKTASSISRNYPDLFWSLLYALGVLFRLFARFH